MKKYLVNAFLLFALLASSKGLGSEHRLPSPEQTVGIDMSDAPWTQRSQTFEYKTDEVAFSGTATLDPQAQTVRLNGVYHSYQNLESDVNLAYQIYDSKDNLLLKEGERSPFTKEADHSTTHFNYLIDLGYVSGKKKINTLVIQFNYVKELEYWADQKFPEIELPSLQIEGVKYIDPIKVSFSWIPLFAPKNVTTYSFHSFSINSSLKSAAKYRPSVEGYFLSDRKRQENERYSVDPENVGKSEFLVGEMTFAQTGRVNRRLGFVLEGVRWHKRSSDTYKSTWVVPVWLYSALAFAFLAIISFVFHFATTSRHKLLRTSSWIAAAVLSIIFLLEFATPLLPVYLLIFAAAVVSIKLEKSCYTVYWLLVFYIITQEFIWGTLQNKHSIFIHGLLFSLFLAPLLVAPLVLIKKSWIATAIANTLVVCFASYYTTTSLYYAFFEDYPTWNILTYSKQGLAVADSIASLIDERLSIVAISVLFYLVALNYSHLLKKKTLAS